MTSPNPRCRIYLIASAAAPYLAPDDVERALASVNIACVLLTGQSSDDIDLCFARDVMNVVRAHETAFLIEADFETAGTLGADGLHIAADLDLYDAARNALGPDVLIGAECGHSRHKAMALAEKGADYVAFDNTGNQSDATHEETAKLVAWWAELFEVPSIAWRVTGEDDALHCARNSADFVAIGEDYWLERNSNKMALVRLDARLGALHVAD